MRRTGSAGGRGAAVVEKQRAGLVRASDPGGRDREAPWCSYLTPNSRIDNRVGEVDQKVDQHESRRKEHHRALDEWEVPEADRSEERRVGKEGRITWAERQ